MLCIHDLLKQIGLDFRLSSGDSGVSSTAQPAAIGKKSVIIQSVD